MRNYPCFSSIPALSLSFLRFPCHSCGGRNLSSYTGSFTFVQDDDSLYFINLALLLLREENPLYLSFSKGRALPCVFFFIPLFAKEGLGVIWWNTSPPLRGPPPLVGEAIFVPSPWRRGLGWGVKIRIYVSAPPVRRGYRGGMREKERVRVRC